MTELTEFQRKLSALLPDVELRFEEALAKHTSFRIGGDAEVMAFPKTKDRTGGYPESLRQAELQMRHSGRGNQRAGAG